MGPRIPIKVKSATALTVPLIMLLVVAGLEVSKAAGQVREVREQTELATAAIGPSGLVTALQNERNFAAMWLLGTEEAVELPVDDIAGSRRQTDAAARDFRAEVERKGGAVSRIYEPALAAMGGLARARETVDGFDGPRVLTDRDETEATWQIYSRVITALSDQNSQLTVEVADDELRRGVRLIDMASREIDRIAGVVRVALLASITGDGRLRDRDEITEASPLKNEAERWHYAIIRQATGRYAALGEELRVESDATRALPVVNEVLGTGDVDVPALLTAISIQDDESYYGFVRDVSTVVRERADELNADARARQRRYLVVAGIVLALAATLAHTVSKSITRPLRSLTRQATDLAAQRLPSAVRGVLDTPPGHDVAVPVLHPVEVAAGDEISEVADTLNAMQGAAVDLAVEQAILRRNVADAFVSLARRNQTLLNRQLDYITELEADETHTATIASLFRLDHHATRMRRNTESLLVLAGAELPPSRQWAAPVPLVDVVRAALGEVEDFTRVDIRGVAPATVVGPAVADLTHLLAELIENALRFSPPTQPVTVQGRGTADGYVLAVVDTGFGMPPADIAQANRRLARSEAYTVAPSKYLGHYVAGTLAARHGVGVRLHGLPAVGLTATVHLPADLLVRDAPAPLRVGPLATRAPVGDPAPARLHAATVAVPPAARSGAIPPAAETRTHVLLADFVAGVRRGRSGG